MTLPEITIGERIADLRTNKGWDQKELAEKIGLSASQMSRIENGKTPTVNSDLLIKLAKTFHVSTDYILGLTPVSVPKSYDISELGLSEGAIKGLVTGKVNVEILNRLLEHQSFPALLDTIQTYFTDTAAMGIMARNQVIDMVTASLADFTADHPEQRGEVRTDMRFLNAQKIGTHEADIEKIKTIFLAILRDIKRDMETGIQTGETATAEMLRDIRAAIGDKPMEQITADDVAAAVTAQVGLAAPMNEETAGMLQSLVKQMLEQAGAEHPAMDEDISTQ